MPRMNLLLNLATIQDTLTGWKKVSTQFKSRLACLKPCRRELLL